MDNCADFSIVIPAYNEEKRMGAVPDSVRNVGGICCPSAKETRR